MVDEKVKVTFQVKAVCLTIISPRVQLKDGVTVSTACRGFYDGPPRAHRTARNILISLK